MSCPGSRHDTLSAYQHYGCRCPNAVEAKRVYTKRQRSGRPEVRRVDATGTVRRIHALMAIGHTAEVIGKAAGRSAAHVVATARTRRFVEPETKAAYRRAYDALSMTPGVSDRTRARARVWGWLPPLAWDDDTIDQPEAKPSVGARVSPIGVDHAAVERALGGDVTALVRDADRREAIRRLVAAGVGDDAIAGRLGMSLDAVRRSRQRHCGSRLQPLGRAA